MVLFPFPETVSWVLNIGDRDLQVDGFLDRILFKAIPKRGSPILRRSLVPFSWGLSRSSGWWGATFNTAGALGFTAPRPGEVGGSEAPKSLGASERGRGFAP